MSAEETGPMTFTMNDTLPKITYASPYCSHCGADVTIEGSDFATCSGCLVVWDDIGEGSSAEADPDYFEGSDVTCGIVEGKPIDPWERRGNRYTPGPPQPCILPSGHKSSHLCPYSMEVTSL